jgi:hypothetical protein
LQAAQTAHFVILWLTASTINSFYQYKILSIIDLQLLTAAFGLEDGVSDGKKPKKFLKKFKKFFLTS